MVDINSKLEFLIDTGAAVSVLPKRYSKDFTSRSILAPYLYAANSQKITTYGTKELTLSFEGNNKLYKWSFIVADICDAIIGADFLSHYDLLVDCRNSKVFERNILTNTGDIKRVQTTDKFPQEIRTHLENAYAYTSKKGDFKCKLKNKHIGTKHYIETNVEQPVAQRCRRLIGEKLEQVREHFKMLQNQGIVRPSKSPWASPLVVVRKSDGSYRPCGDYRRLNDVTIPDRYPLPRIEDVLHKVGNGKIFSKIDLEKAYHQIEMNERDIPKTAIITPFGLFEYVYMPFGLKCAAQSFQRHIDNILRPLSKFCQSYIDDIIIYSQTKEEHTKHVVEVIKHLQDANMKINQNKCAFFKTTVDFLGYTLSPQGVKPMEDRIKAMRNLLPPKNINELQKFLGTIAFFHRCIPNVASLLSPLYKLQSSIQKRKCEWFWTEEHDVAFCRAKQSLCNSIPLCVPDFNSLFEITTDASNLAIGASLQQKGKPLAFYSRTLTDCERRYSTYDKELLAIFSTVKHFSYMIEGASILIKTHHKPLLYMNNMKEPSQRQWRWINFLSEYKIVFQHIEGSKNTVADMLSRVVYCMGNVNSIHPSMDKNNFNITEDELQRRQNEDNDLKKLWKNCSSLRIVRIKGLLYDISTAKPRLILPQSLRESEIKRLHSFSHPGWKATYSLVAERYVWPEMQKNIREFVRSCERCQRSKIVKHTKSPYKDLPTLDNERLAVVHIDLVGPLPSSQGFKYLLTIIDRETNWVEAIAMRSITTEHVIKSLCNHWIVRFGVPSILISDQGTQFQSEEFRIFAQNLGIELRRSTAYHPQTNGKVERFHRTLKTALRCQIDCNGGSWYQHLPWVMLGIRNTVYSEIGSPSQRLYGSNVVLPGDYFSNNLVVNDRWRSYENIKQAIQSFPRNAKVYSRKRTYVPEKLTTCSEVWLKKEVTRGIESPYSGPYKVLSRDSDRKTFVIDKDGIHLRVNIDKLKPAWFKEDIE